LKGAFAGKTSAAIVLSLATVLLIIINAKTTGRHMEGIRIGLKQMIGLIPMLLSAFVLAGMLEAVIPEGFVSQWLAREAGLKGILLGTVAGMLSAVGPYAFFPIVASISASGAGLGTVVSLVVGWCLLGLSRLPYEAGLLGMKFSLVRMAVSLPICIIAGMAAHAVELLIM